MQDKKIESIPTSFFSLSATNNKTILSVKRPIGSKNVPIIANNIKTTALLKGELIFSLLFISFQKSSIDFIITTWNIVFKINKTTFSKEKSITKIPIRQNKLIIKIGDNLYPGFLNI